LASTQGSGTKIQTQAAEREPVKRFFIWLQRTITRQAVQPFLYLSLLTKILTPLSNDAAVFSDSETDGAPED